MRQSMFIACLFLFALTGGNAQQPPIAQSRPAGIRLDALTWQAAARELRDDTVVVLPLGAGAAEHGPHLPLGTDQRLAEYLTRRILDGSDVVVAPPLTYHYYPAFVEYPGSTSLALNTARDLTADVARSFARHGPRRFYVLNTSPASMPALAETAKLVARDGLLLRYTDPRARLESVMRTLQQQRLGNHADEIETSMMLHVDASAVDMTQATRELWAESRPLYLTRQPGGRGTYSPSGVWGDATVATRDKGAALVEALVKAIRTDIEDLRRTAPPAGGAATPGATPPAAPGRFDRVPANPGECLPGDDRAIRAIGSAFALHWANQDAIRLANLWTPEGDMVHPDGFTERTAQTIRENRAALFARPEYRASRHGLYVGPVRCLTQDVAVADAKWDLRQMTDGRGNPLSPVEGLCTLVLRRREDGWGIEAYRYTMKQTQSTNQPTVLNRPGFTGIR